jgi:putative SOS response-associated peptidase YedK
VVDAFDGPVVRYDPKERQRSLELMWWGSIPYWAKDIKIGYSTINAMAETVETKPAFREAFRRRRCLVLVGNLPKTGKERQPYAIALADRSIMALAGLWETWRSPGDQTVRGLVVITTEPNELFARSTTAGRSSSIRLRGRSGLARSRPPSTT